MTSPEATPGPSPFAAYEAVYDPESVRLLYARGIDDGWRCLEVGAGGGSLIKWFCQRVGKNGRVVATDLDIQYLAALEEPNLEVHEHDVRSDPLPEGVFDLIHVRLVLSELPEPESALARLSTALKRGGVLVTEELDSCSVCAAGAEPETAELFARVEASVQSQLKLAGSNPELGRELVGLLQRSGLSEVVARGGSSVFRGGSPGSEIRKSNLAKVRPASEASDEVSGDDLLAYKALLEDPSFAFFGPLMVTAWGWRTG